MNIMTRILACMVMDEDTGRPMYTHFFDKDLQKNPTIIPQKIRAKEIYMINELGIQLNLVFSVLADSNDPILHERLKEFRDRIERTYPEGMKQGQGTFGDFVILEEIIRSVFVDRD